MSEAAWNKAFTHGSKSLQDRLKKVHANNPKFQSWMQRSGHATDTSVKQASKEVKPTERVKKLQAKSITAYGATKGAKVGGEHGSEDMRDTIAPLTRDQHSKVQAAERAAKAAAKAAAPAKPKKPLSQAERMAAIARAVTKAKAKDRFDVPTVNPDDMDHEDLRDVHNQMHIRGTYSEATDRMALIKAVASKSKMNKPVKLTKKPDTIKKMIGRHKYFSHIDDVTGYDVKSKGKGMNRFEEVELDEVTKQEAEKMLGGAVKTKPSNAPAGKHPYGFRRARNLARQAMKAGKTVTESTTEVSEVNEMNHGKKLAKMIMAKQSKHPIAQHMGEAKDEREYGYEGDMAMSQLKSIIANAQKLHDMLEPDTDLPEWVQSKITLAEDYVVTAANYCASDLDEEAIAALEAELVEEIELFEKAPPGSKYERMVKHIKKGYAKGGLTPKEKSIAYATAWKAYKKNEETEAAEETLDEKYMGFKAVMAAAKKGGARDPAAVAAAIGRKKYGKEKFQAMAAAGKKKANEETEVVTEAEGKVAVTPKEKDLAAHHGDPSRITYGDVIKARLKSAAAKKMGKK